MNHVAVITGGSNGIGYALAKIHACRGNDLVLVARDQEKLHAAQNYLEQEFNVTVKTISADLADPATPRKIYDQLKQDGIVIEFLINNAGFGGYGLFYERPLAKDLEMIAVNIRAVTELTRLFLPDMIARGTGKILNVASTAGMLPGPLQSVYYASKAYVISWSQAIANEVAGKGVTVTVLCSGATATGFAKASGVEKTMLFKNVPLPDTVAAAGYAGMLAGTLVSTPNKLQGFALRYLIPFVPRRWVLRASRRVMDKA